MCNEIRRFMDSTLTLTVNGQRHTVTTDPQRPLLHVLREDLGLTGTKYGCGEGQCGACTVLLEGRREHACLLPVRDAAGKSVTTIEGLSTGAPLHPVQRAFLAVWTATPIAMPKREHFVSMQQLADWGRTYHKEIFDLMPDFTDDRLAENINVPWSRFMEQRYAHKPEETTVHETMLQVLLHSSYHRGQVNARLRELGAEPPMVDYIGWLWFGRPAAEWK